MCGIAGEFVYGQGNPVAPEILKSMSEVLTPRGPDGSAIWLAKGEHLGFAHTRLAILDLSENAAQPMHDEFRRYSIVFNGEIYNFEELRNDLIARSRKLTSTGDTEVLLNMYAEYGLSMLERLRGMYAFAIWDELEHELILARDPLGIKPLYYADDGRSICFSSQVRGLLIHPKVDQSPEAAGHVGFFVWGTVPEPFTLYKGIRALPAGNWLKVRHGQRVEIRPFAQPINAMKEVELSRVPSNREEMHERLHFLLRESVHYHLKSDVPVAIFQSAGLDSSVITSLVSEVHSNEVHALTLGFDQLHGTAGDEVPLASLVAKEYGIGHTYRYLGQESFFKHREHLFASMDQPTIDGINVYFISLLAKECGYKVALSGLGGDELFGGYPSFQQIPRTVHMLKFLPPGTMLGRGVRRLSAKTLGHFSSPKYAGLLEYGGNIPGAYLLRRSLFMPWELPAFLDADIVREGWNRLASPDKMDQMLLPLEKVQPRTMQEFMKISALEMSLYMRNQLLRDADWASMANSVEVRVPFVDLFLVKQLGTLRFSGYPPRKIDMATCLPHALPKALIHRPKTGFQVPVREWIREKEDHSGERGLRGWAKYVYQRFTGTSIST